MPRLLLHACCAPCAAYPLQVLLSAGYEVSLYFYNPNIHPLKEYRLRLEEIKRYARGLDKPVRVIEGPYEIKTWFKAIAGLESEPEGGRRCAVCYRLRLAATAALAAELGFDYFGSALSISPHKKASLISQLGHQLAREYKINFFDRDWKKQNGFKFSCEISRRENFYRQDYCGCVFSRLEREKIKQARRSSAG